MTILVGIDSKTFLVRFGNHNTSINVCELRLGTASIHAIRDN